MHIVVADYRLHPLYMQTKARNVAIESYNVTRIFHRNLYNVKHTVCNCSGGHDPNHGVSKSVV
jgi:hypothetical protein